MPVLEKVTSDDALTRVTDALGELARDGRLNHGHVHVTCSPEDLPRVAEKLREAEGIRCRFFNFLSGIDWTAYGEEEEDRKPYDFEVLLHLYSPDTTIHVTVHVPLGSDLRCRSITEVFAGASWHERETYEMFGIVFDGHPNLVPLYLPEDFEGHPLRKSFKLPTRLVKQWPGAKDPEEAGGKS